MSLKNKPSIMAEYDDLIRRYKVIIGDNEQSDLKFLQFAESSVRYFEKYQDIELQLIQIQDELMKSKTENNNLQLKLKNARQLLDTERCKRHAVEKEKYDLERQISMVVEMLGQGNFNETKEKLQLLSSTFSGFHHGPDTEKPSLREVLSPNHLSTINEDADTLGSILNVSEMDLTDGDELEFSVNNSGKGLHSSRNQRISGHKRKSSPDRVDSKKTIRVSKNENEEKENDRRPSRKLSEDKSLKQHMKFEYLPSAPPLVLCTADNIDNKRKDVTPFKSTPFGNSLQHTPSKTQFFTPTSGNFYSSPGNSPLLRNYSNSKVNCRQHCFMSKMIYWTDFCQPCEKRIKFGKSAYKCRDCRATCHMECKDAVPLPCVPTINTPGGRTHVGSIADFAPRVSPMVPALIIHCTNEIEKRGLNEVGIYRVPGSDREVKELRDRFLKGKGVPNLSKIDIHVVCGTIKSFLRVLKEPLIPNSFWKDFVSATEKSELQDAFAVLYQAISAIPQPNQDTLAWMVCHLQKVADCPECKMPSSNLARVFGPTLLGYSVADPEPCIIVEETKLQQKVIELILQIPTDYWETFITIPEDICPPKFAPSPEKNNRTSQRRSLLSNVTLPQLEAH